MGKNYVSMYAIKDIQIESLSMTAIKVIVAPEFDFYQF